MTTQPPLPMEEPVDNPEQSTYTEYGSGQDTAAEITPTADSTSIEQSTTVDSTLPQAEQTPAPAFDVDAEQRKIAEERANLQAEQERESTIRALEQEAMNMEKNLMNQGLNQTEAQQQTQTHLQNRVTQIQAQEQMKTQVQIEQGKRNASVHFAKQYNLGIDSLSRLEQAQTPTEMKAMAENMSSMAKLEKENSELKARLAPQQSFDTNTPTPAAATNEDRLLDAYLEGDRSDAATKAAAKLLGI